MEGGSDRRMSCEIQERRVDCAISMCWESWLRFWVERRTFWTRGWEAEIKDQPAIKAMKRQGTN